MTISSYDRITFQETGILSIRGLLAKSRTKAAQEALLTELERLRFRVNGRWQTKQVEHSSPFKITSKISANVREQEAFTHLLSGELCALMDTLAGVKLSPAQAHPQILVSLPQKQPWSLPKLGWHIDLASPSPATLAGIQPFVLIDDIDPQGGATVAIAGSHKLHPHSKAAGSSVHETLKNDQAFGKLFAAERIDEKCFFKPTLVKGVEVFVVEMWGKAGDVYLMDMRVLHAPALNATKRPRLMATGRYLKP